MPVVITYAQLRELSIDDLIRRFDQTAETQAQLSLPFIREEIARRDAAAQTGEIVRMTKQMRDMTVTIVGLTLINVFLTGVLLFK